MTEELFHIPESLSPKLQWLNQHGLATQYIPKHLGVAEDEFGNKLFPWLCLSASHDDYLKAWQQAGGGFTEDEAIISYCEKHAIKHYSLP